MNKTDLIETVHDRVDIGGRTPRSAVETVITNALEVIGDELAKGHTVLVTNTSGHAPTPLEGQVPTLASGDHQALVSAFLTKFYGTCIGSGMAEPVHTITAGGQANRDSTGSKHGLVLAHLQRDFGQSVGHPADVPCGTITGGGGGHERLVASFLTKYYGEGFNAHGLGDPANTVTSKDRLGLVTVTVQGQPYVLADIGLRMLQPRELFRAQGFPDSYRIDLEVDGRRLSKSDQVRLCGNSVCPPVAAALVRANCGFVAHERAVGDQQPALPLTERQGA